VHLRRSHGVVLWEKELKLEHTAYSMNREEQLVVVKNLYLAYLAMQNENMIYLHRVIAVVP
jgi:hypothetical protein